VKSLADESLFLKRHCQAKEKHETASQWGGVFASLYVQLDSCKKYQQTNAHCILVREVFCPHLWNGNV